MNKRVVTMRSVCVSTNFMARAASEKTRKKTNAWKPAAALLVVRFMNLILFPVVVRRTPGLRARKSDAGRATFGDVMSGSICYTVRLFMSECSMTK